MHEHEYEKEIGWEFPEQDWEKNIRRFNSDILWQKKGLPDIPSGPIPYEQVEQKNLVQEQDPSNLSSLYTHYVSFPKLITKSGHNNSLSGVCDDISIEYLEEIYSSLRQLQRYEWIWIPNKVKRILDRFISVKDLREINKDVRIARELCLLFLSNLSNTYHTKRWKSLSSSKMSSQLSYICDSTYRKIIDIMEKGTELYGSIINVDRAYCVGEHNRQYALSDRYFGKGAEHYELKQPYVIGLKKKEFFNYLADATNNQIAKNLFHAYSLIRLPFSEEIRTEAEKLVKEGYRTKKGKLLTWMNKHKRERWKDADKRAFIEDDMELFNALTKGGYAIPIIGDERSGGRVYDSINMMPSWLRNMITIEEQRLVEVDYRALHPNLAIKIYSGQTPFITHEDVALKANVDRGDVKIEHLSFFNKTWRDMSFSPLFKFYCETEPNMMQAIFRDKQENGHEITSKRMFALEVEIMTTAISKLNSEGIYVLYIFDALQCQKKDQPRVLEVMNQTAKQFGVFTTAK